MKKIISLLKKHYPKASCSLRHSNPFELLIATILSAQCTDERVNLVTKKLFKKYPTPLKLAKGNIKEIKEIIRPTGFYNNKALSIKKTAQKIVLFYSSKVPEKMEELLTLDGVARKTANVVLGTAFNKAEGIAVDTHVKRLSFRLGFTKETNPEKVEMDLLEKTEKKDRIWISHALIEHGRKICAARNPKCRICFLIKLCPKKGL